MSELAALYGADLGAAAWYKSSYTASNGNCVEVARISAPGAVGIAIRDSKDTDIPPARASREAWRTFLSAVVRGTVR